MFEKVLIANRGEIAIRIAHTCRELGIRTVAICSEADRRAPHRLAADEWIEVGPAPAPQSYLNIEAILEAAKASGADAIHPGYGFLSENAAFAEAVLGDGLTFIGPSAEAMRLMADKAAARQLAQRAGVPIAPGTDALDEPKAIEDAARTLGLPVLLKAAGGGGGKGMRKIDEPKQLNDAIAAAQREAIAAFGDQRLIVEKYIEPARHIEIQIIADAHAQVFSIGERECSLQRRHQKIIEEAPSSAVDRDLRHRMEEAARALIAEAEYTNAGTVEFLLGPEGDFYFLEVNARLQVEHPVTELVYGLDLVRLQLEVAWGARLPLEQSSLEPRGHAIEARLYAEDPERDFLPMSGRILALDWADGPGIRIDSGIVAGTEVLPHYDPMLAKLIAWGPDREQARSRILATLRGSLLLGTITNQAFLIELIDSEPFRTGAISTQTVDNWERAVWELPDAMLLLAAAARREESASLRDSCDEEVGGKAPSPWSRLGRWRALD